MTTSRVVSNDSRDSQDITIRKFQLAADELPALGGDDTGPAPFEWTLTGLGAGKAITFKYLPCPLIIVRNYGAGLCSDF